jgi:hypothetical protein
MNLFKKYFQLAESTALTRYYRSKGLEPPKKLNPYEQLEKYKDDPNIYISFRNIKRIGINPKSYYNTPNGVYSYPLSLIWKDFDHLKKQIYVPFASEHPYIYVFKPRNINKGLFLNKYTENDFKIDIQKLRNSLFVDKSRLDFLLTVVDKFSLVGTPSGRIWFITYGLTLKKSTKEIIQYPDILEYEVNSNYINLWNKLLYKVLGYDYVIDDGQGIIHESEPTQAVFFSSSVINTVNIIDGEGSWILKAKISDDANYDVGEGENSGTYVYWHDGTWYRGTWYDGTWSEGTWMYGTWENGVWQTGIWKDGKFKSGLWLGGHWKKGTWSGTEWHGGTWHDGTWESGIWYNGTWKGGDWLGGEWKGGYDKNADFHVWGDSPDKWDIK